MSSPSQTAELEAALLARARAQSEKYLADAHRMHDELVAGANERLRLREDREARLAREFSERTYRQRVQAGEIRLQRELEWLRWHLVQDAIAALSDRLGHLVENEEDYLPVLAGFLARAAAAIGSGGLVAEVNARDWTRISGRWESFCQAAGVTTAVQLASEPLHCLGGIRVRDAGDTMRVDFTIEARLERMREALEQVITGRLFPAPVSSADGAP